ncbi:Uncharacterized oxidoreductase At1g06690, chloroplastic [Seminavis robusta]|uniref:Uncharacterized oxidoreductase At1g06690, chloroplastic n=1 Tax=Seminavis robusta TaxID=568900 RepID=A0A9N8H7F2_9STRA|nr:Uncharacterized oxidoreductase At1g06690, chloroplastic [Seminavis robusta]|eukprot:Sro177_g077710.1 Uncharacterized oxidoreductase At1g06690, chloroplastic (336) ;mRNA; r:31992-32999
MQIAPIAVGSLNHFGGKDDDRVVVNILKCLPPRTLIDTAELYGDGDTESVLGKCMTLAGQQWATDNDDDSSSGIYCATKYAPNMFRRKPEDVVQACQESISKLKCQPLHLYQAHYSASILPSLPFVGPVRDETVWEGLAQCYEQGLVENIGVCNYGPKLIRQAHDYFAARKIPLVSNQVNYNLMRASAALETVQVCDELGIAVLAYHPLGKGTLTGTYDEMDEPTMSKLKGKYSYYTLKRWLKSTPELRKAISQISSSTAMDGNAKKRSRSQVAVSWVIRKGRVPIIGARSAEQAQDLLDAVDWELTDEQVVILDEAAALANSNWTVLGKEFKLV